MRKAPPAGWRIEGAHFVLSLDNFVDDASSVAKYINMGKDNLGVYLCERSNSGGYEFRVELP